MKKKDLAISRRFMKMNKKSFQALCFGLVIFFSFLAGSITMIYFKGITITNYSINGNLIGISMPDCYISTNNDTFILLPSYIYNNHSFPVSICHLDPSGLYNVSVHLNTNSGQLIMTVFITNQSITDTNYFAYWNSNMVFPDNSMLILSLYQNNISFPIAQALTTVVNLPSIQSQGVI